jgi:hypothetical protein
MCGLAEAALAADANERAEDNVCSMKITQEVREFSIDEFQAWNEGGLKADDQIRRKLKDTVIFNRGTYSATSRDIKYWSCMMPTRTQWKQLAFASGLIDENQLLDPSEDQEQLFYILFGGVYLATKAMPTGVTIDLRASGEAGYPTAPRRHRRLRQAPLDLDPLEALLDLAQVPRVELYVGRAEVLLDLAAAL